MNPLPTISANKASKEDENIEGELRSFWSFEFANLHKICLMRVRRVKNHFVSPYVASNDA